MSKNTFVRTSAGVVYANKLLTRFVLVSIAFCSIAAIDFAQDSDTQPPQLQSLAFTPVSVDVSSSPQSVAVDLNINDNLSGVASVQVQFVSPNQSIAEALAGSLGGGNYRAVVTIPQYAAVGTWQLRLILRDNVGNIATLTSAFLQTNGFPFSIPVTSVPADTTPPVPVGITFIPNSVDVSTGPQTVVVRIQVNDDLSGVVVDPLFNSGFSFILQSPVGQQIRRFNADFVVTGGPSATTWETTLTIPRYADAATWRVSSLRVADVAGNIRNHSTTSLSSIGITSSLQVQSTISDRTAPALVGFSFTPTVINTALGPGVVRVSMHLTDDLSGVSFANRTFFNRLFFTSPSGQVVAAFQPDFSITSGTVLNGIWEADLRFPQFSEAGTWRPTFLRLEDAVFNLRFLNLAGIQALGFPTDLIILRPSLVSDGIFGPAGGTVQDQTFGNRASLTAPPGVLPGNIDVAIDVFVSPLTIPIPVEFESGGSLYVNFQFSPNPSPLPAPGLTIVLPLQSPRTPGLTLSLYKIEPATGNLVAALDAAGNPISGTVDPSGQSATFGGVVNFSTFVGLLPRVKNVAIDIKPGSSTNPIELNSNGTTPVAILSSATFDATTVDPSTVVLAGAVYRQSNLEDVNGDGLLDLSIRVKTSDLLLSRSDTQAELTGRTYNGYRIRGVDSVRAK